MKIADALNEAGAVIEQGGVVVIPTDTLYGLACRADDPTAVKRLYGIKERDNKPGTIIAASVDQLVGLGIKRRYLKAVEQYWPGAISIVIPCGAELAHLHLGKGSLAVRVSSDKKLNTLIMQTGPLLTSSANHPGRPPANTIQEAVEYFGDSVDAYIDGGDMSDRLPSTVIRILDDAIDVLRVGAVKINEKGEIEE